MALQKEFELQGNFLFKYRGSIPILILILGVIAYVNHLLQLKSVKESGFEGVYTYICFTITLCGFAIRVYTIGHVFENTSGRNIDKQIADELNTTGIYSIMRHPLYVGNFFMWFGFALLSENLWFILAFIFIYVAYYERIMFAEEQFLKRKFSNSYLKWAGDTPAIIPRFKSYKSPVTTFNIEKVLKQEKTGFLLIFLLYFAFAEIRLCITRKAVAIEYDFWFYSMVFSLFMYLVIKILQKKNGRLHL